MSSEKHSLKIGKRQIVGAIIGATLGATISVLMATSMKFDAPSDAVIMILKWTGVLAVIGMLISWAIIIDTIRWAALGAVVGAVIGAAIAVIEGTNQVTYVVSGMLWGIFGGLVIGTARWLFLFTKRKK